MRRNRISGYPFHIGGLMIFTDEDVKIVHSWLAVEVVL